MKTIMFATWFVLLTMFGCTSPPDKTVEVPEPVDWDSVDEFLTSTRVEADEPPNGFVPDEQTAILIAEALSAALYGAQKTEDEKPFRARLRNEIWTVVGTLRPAGIYGGVATFQISKNDGRVLFAIHGE